MSRPATSFGIGRFQDRRKAEVCRFLEQANWNLAEIHDLIPQIWADPSVREPISECLALLQKQIGELKRLVKQ